METLDGGVPKRKQDTADVANVGATYEADPLPEHEIITAMLCQRTKPGGTSALGQQEQTIVVLLHPLDPKFLLAEWRVAPDEAQPGVSQSIVPVFQPVVRLGDFCGFSCAGIKVKGLEWLIYSCRCLEAIVESHRWVGVEL